MKNKLINRLASLVIFITGSIFSGTVWAVNVGYYELCNGQGTPNHVPVIVNAGETPVLLTDVTAADLAGLDLAFVTNCSNGGYSAEWSSNLPAITSAVNAGMKLIFHDRRVSEAALNIPGAASISFFRETLSDGRNIDIVDNSTLVTNGTSGIINNFSLDNGSLSTHGYADATTLPLDAKNILSRTNSSESITFSYPLGSGFVIYSTIPLDHYLVNFSSTIYQNMKIYASNIIEYAASLDSNGSPTANAGTDQTVNEGEFVNLDGTGSLDPDGDGITYIWSQIAGPAVILDDETSPSPNFTAPYLDTNQVLSFELIVNDGKIDSSPDYVDITVLQFNSPPVADAGSSSTVKEGAGTALDGTYSYDPDAEPIISYLWTQTAGPTVTLVGEDTSTPTFVAPTGTAGQSVTFELVVSDGKEQGLPDTVTVDIVLNSPPEANAGVDQTKDEGSIVILAGSGSDPDLGDSISFSWVQTAGPIVALTGGTTATPSFEAPPVLVGPETFTFELTVTDDDNPSGYNILSDIDSVDVHVRSVNDPPSCNLAYADAARLWPPNHKMVPVEILGVMDKDSMYNNVSIVITGVTQDEPIDGTGDGDTSPDAVIVKGEPADSVVLRSERAGEGNGRVYVVYFEAGDGFESCNGSVTVTVPHDRKGSDSVDDGQFVDSTQP